MNAADNKKLESDVVVFTENASRYETENTMLAALLLTLGVSMKCTSGSVLIGSGVRVPQLQAVIGFCEKPGAACRHPQGEKEGPGAVGCGSVLAGRGGGFSWRPAFNLT